MIYLQKLSSPVGLLTLAAEDESLIGLWIDGQKYFMRGLENKPCQFSAHPVFSSVKDWLERYFSGQKPLASELPLSPGGSEFARSVWSMLTEIPYGGHTTYGNLAKEYERRYAVEQMSAQAVGGAVGHNPISIIIPCHRVIGAGGKLTGYAGGLEIKKYLLEHEKRSIKGNIILRGGEFNEK